ncbi:MAG: SDR family oxidoreductase [Acidimicrobiales bacterium]
MIPTGGRWDLSGSTVLVTGGSRGLGLGLVKAFSAAGADVVACGRNRPPDWPGPEHWLKCDVRDPDSVTQMVDQAAGARGHLDVVVNNAGGSPSAPAASMSPRLFERVVALNMVAPFYVSQCANAVMQGQEGGGVIINIGSAAAIRPAPGTAAYNAAKAGLVALTRSLAIEWAPKVRVNCVSVGLLRTESAEETYGSDLRAVAATVPMGRLAGVDDVAAACLMLASPGAGYITGANLMVDGGGEVPSFLQAVKPKPGET